MCKWSLKWECGKIHKQEMRKGSNNKKKIYVNKKSCEETLQNPKILFLHLCILTPHCATVFFSSLVVFRSHFSLSPKHNCLKGMKEDSIGCNTLRERRWRNWGRGIYVIANLKKKQINRSVYELNFYRIAQFASPFLSGFLLLVINKTRIIRRIEMKNSLLGLAANQL